MHRSSSHGVPLVLALSLAVTGCATTTQVDPASSERPDATQGYVTAVASIEGFRFGLVLTDPVGREHLVRFDPSQQLFLPKARVRRALLALPPGDYRVNRWVIGDSLSPDAGIHPIPETNPLGRSFALRAGHLVELGSLDATKTTVIRFGRLADKWSVSTRAVAADELVKLVRESSPGFADWRIECLTCTAPSSSSREAATPPPRPAPRRNDAGVVVHYRRTDGNYDGWVLSSYESFQRPEDLRDRSGRSTAEARAVRGASWEHPAEPTGRDEFGIYWVLDERNFRNGRVNFAIHRGDRKLESSKDRFWSIADSMEGWTTEDDERVWPTRADAERALQP